MSDLIVSFSLIVALNISQHKRMRERDQEKKFIRRFFSLLCLSNIYEHSILTSFAFAWDGTSKRDGKFKEHRNKKDFILKIPPYLDFKYTYELFVTMRWQRRWQQHQQHQWRATRRRHRTYFDRWPVNIHECHVDAKKKKRHTEQPLFRKHTHTHV